MRALVVCTGGGIGDVLLATPAMRALHDRFDEVVALTSAAHRDVLLGNPDLGAVLVDDAPLWTMRERLRAGSFDAAVVTWATLRSALLPFVAGIPERVGQARRSYSALFTKRVTVRSELGDHNSHWTQILLDYARALGCDDPTGMPVFPVADSARRAVRVLLDEGGIGQPYVMLHPTRGIAARLESRWPAQSVGGLGRALGAAFGVPVVVTGSASDAPVAQSVASAAGGVCVAGRTSLAEFGALAAGALAVVAMDSGPMHVAAAVGAPTVGIFALRSDEPQRWAPLGPRTAVVRGTYPCPRWHRKETCPDFACVRELPQGEVIAAALRLAGASGAAQARVEA